MFNWRSRSALVGTCSSVPLCTRSIPIESDPDDGPIAEVVPAFARVSIEVVKAQCSQRLRYVGTDNGDGNVLALPSIRLRWTSPPPRVGTMVEPARARCRRVRTATDIVWIGILQHAAEVWILLARATDRLESAAVQV